MILRDNSNEYNSLYHASLRWARADSTNFPFDPDYIQYLNLAANKLSALVKRYDSDWKWIDSNNTSELLDTTLNLTSSVSKYTIPAGWKKIARVRIKESDGTTWRTLEKKNRRQVTDDELVGSYIQYYFVLGGYLYLVGVPTYTQANGIEVEYQTGASAFVPADTGEEVGFNNEFEELAILMPALDYLDINGPEEQARKVRDKIGTEPRAGQEGTGLLGALVASFLERHDAPEKISLAKSPRAVGLLEHTSDINPLY